MKEWRGKGKGKEIAGTITTWGEGWEIPYGEDAASIHMSAMFADLQSSATTPLIKKTPVCALVCVERAFPPHEVAPKLGHDKTVELLKRVLGASEHDLDLSALSAALKTKLGLSDLKKPSPTMSLGVALLTRDVKSCRGIRSSPMDTCPSPFHPRVRTMPTLQTPLRLR